MGWIGSFLDRADAVFETISGRGVPITTKPSELFARQCFICGDPDETAAPLIIDHVGAQLLHVGHRLPAPGSPGHVGGRAHPARGTTVGGHARDAFLGGNVRRIYGLTV